MSDIEEFTDVGSESDEKMEDVTEEIRNDGEENHDTKTLLPMEEDNDKRFIKELEFVQSLANPYYLCFLAQHGYFKNPSFKRYISYLSYFEKPEYLKYIKYPQCLQFRRLLENPIFCNYISQDQNMDHVYRIQDKFWYSYNLNRLNTTEPVPQVVIPEGFKKKKKVRAKTKVVKET